MLVTELAPLGALCDYLPENKVCVNCPKLSLELTFNLSSLAKQDRLSLFENVVQFNIFHWYINFTTIHPLFLQYYTIF